MQIEIIIEIIMYLYKPWFDLQDRNIDWMTVFKGMSICLEIFMPKGYGKAYIYIYILCVDA